MATEDLKHESYFSISNLNEGFDDARKEKYRNLLSQIYDGLIVTVDYDATVRFIFTGEGLTAISPRWLKGIEYTASNSKIKGDIVQSLDKANSLAPGVYLREIEANWFILYQRTND
jgi:hypothetical protein